MGTHGLAVATLFPKLFKLTTINLQAYALGGVLAAEDSGLSMEDLLADLG